MMGFLSSRLLGQQLSPRATNRCDATCCADRPQFPRRPFHWPQPASRWSLPYLPHFWVWAGLVTGSWSGSGSRFNCEFRGFYFLPSKNYCPALSTRVPPPGVHAPLRAPSQPLGCEICLLYSSSNAPSGPKRRSRINPSALLAQVIHHLLYQWRRGGWKR